MDAFSACVADNKPVRTPGDLGLRDIRIILAVLELLRQDGRLAKIA